MPQWFYHRPIYPLLIDFADPISADLCQSPESISVDDSREVAISSPKTASGKYPGGKSCVFEIAAEIGWVEANETSKPCNLHWSHTVIIMWVQIHAAIFVASHFLEIDNSRTWVKRNNRYQGQIIYKMRSLTRLLFMAFSPSPSLVPVNISRNEIYSIATRPKGDIFRTKGK